MKFSKDLLELRDKEAKLVRMKRYEEAEKVKMKADLLEEFERNKLEAEVSITPSIAIKRQSLKPHFDLPTNIAFFSRMKFHSKAMRIKTALTSRYLRIALFVTFNHHLDVSHGEHH